MLELRWLGSTHLVSIDQYLRGQKIDRSFAVIMTDTAKIIAVIASEKKQQYHLVVPTKKRRH